MSEIKLKKLAEKGDRLAAYYLGKYYWESKHNVNDCLYWLLVAQRDGFAYGGPLLGQLSYRYPDKVKDIQKQVEAKWCRYV